MDPVALPGIRDARGTLDGDPDASAVVVACPPHPQHGGSRSNPILVAVSDALGDRGVACLRFDYGPWDGGRGERRDVENALRWARERFESVGLFGYSFGASVGLHGAAAADPRPNAVSVLAPPRDAGDALDALECPVQVVYGERDDTVDWRPVVERARARSFVVESLPADHHFVGQSDQVGAVVVFFLAPSL